MARTKLVAKRAASPPDEEESPEPKKLRFTPVEQTSLSEDQNMEEASTSKSRHKISVENEIQKPNEEVDRNAIMISPTPSEEYFDRWYSDEQDEDKENQEAKEFKDYDSPFLKLPVTSNLIDPVPLDVMAIVLTYVSAADMFSFISCSKRIYESFKAARLESIDEIRLWYLNKRQLETYKNVNNVKLPERAIDSRLINVYQQKEVTLPAATFEDFKKQFDIHAQLSNNENIGKYILEEVFEFNKNSKAQKIVVAGGSIHKTVHREKLESKMYFTSYTPPDIDLFLLEYGRPKEESNDIIQKLLLNVQKKIDNKKLQFVVSMQLSTLCIVSKEKKHPDIQFILRRVSTLEELLIFFDLDAARFAYDGENVFTVREGLRSSLRHLNFVPKAHNKTGMYSKRAMKYGDRGVETVFFDTHPLDHLHPMTTPTVSNPHKYFSKNVMNRIRDDDAGMYSTLNRLPYSEVLHIYRVGLDNYEGTVDTDLGSEVYREELKEVLKKVDITLALSFDELFALNSSDQFTEGYKDSHLMHKYFIMKCYLCGIYRKLKTMKECRMLKNATCSCCSKFNAANKYLSADLSGKVAIVTGARIKIGLEVALKLLRSGAQVIATTRFPATALEKYKACQDYNTWKDKLVIYPLDLKSSKSIVEFTDYVKLNFKRVHILINNAAQTVRRPIAYYKSIIEGEQTFITQQETILKAIEGKKPPKGESSTSSAIAAYIPPESYISLCKSTLSVTLSQPESSGDKQNTEQHFPAGKKDKFGEPLDLRSKNTWKIPLPETEFYEIGEVQMVNSIAPSILVSGLFEVMKPPTIAEQLKEQYLQRHPSAENKELPQRELTSKYKTAHVEHSYIINVTSHEGHFHSEGKTDFHVHTNISKAALNMLTRSSSAYFAKKGILMNSVDTGWISSSIDTFKVPPLDCVDGAARIMHPIFTQAKQHGVLFKNYTKQDLW